MMDNHAVEELVFLVIFLFPFRHEVWQKSSMWDRVTEKRGSAVPGAGGAAPAVSPAADALVASETC